MLVRIKYVTSLPRSSTPEKTMKLKAVSINPQLDQRSGPTRGNHSCFLFRPGDVFNRTAVLIRMERNLSFRLKGIQSSPGIPIRRDSS